MEIRTFTRPATDELDEPSRAADTGNRQWRRRQHRNAPSRHRGGRLPEIDRFGLSSPPAQGEPDHARFFRGELKPSRRCHGQAGQFGDDGAEAAVAQRFLKAGKDCLFVACLDIDHAIRRQAGLGQGGREQVRSSNAPEHHAARSGRNPGGEQRCRRTVNGAVAAARHLMQRATGQSASRKARIHLGDPEGQHRTPTCSAAVDARDTLSEVVNDRLGGGPAHALATISTGDMFYICSHHGEESIGVRWSSGGRRLVGHDLRGGKDMTITIHIDGARPEEIIRGLVAAQEVFDRAGVSAEDAATARFVVEGWDVRGFVGKVPEAELEIYHLWDEADDAAVKACCAGWPLERVPRSASLELISEPAPFRLTPPEENSDRLFETAEAGILEEMCEQGCFNDGRPEDEVAYLLEDWDLDALSDQQRRLYEERLRPLMRMWFFDRGHFDEEYDRHRTGWLRDVQPDERQLNFFLLESRFGQGA